MQVVSLVLAEGPGHPAGDVADRLRLEVWLTPLGQLDAAVWEAGSAPWRTARSVNGAVTRSGELVKTAAGWALRELSGQDEPLYRVTIGIARPGELVSVARLDGSEMIYRIVAVEAEEPPSPSGRGSG